MKKHYHFIDALRGFAIINMVLFHFLYDVYVVYGDYSNWYREPAVRLWQQFICFSFIFIAGISFHFSNKNLKRGLLLNIYGIGITVVTLVFMPSETIWFGILNFMGCAILLLHFVKKPLQKLKPFAGIITSLFLFICTYDLRHVVPFPGFTSSDYFPISPWFFLFLMGYYFWSLIANRNRISAIMEHKIPILSAIGRYSIWIYLAHQPVCILICELLF